MKSVCLALPVVLVGACRPATEPSRVWVPSAPMPAPSSSCAAADRETVFDAFMSPNDDSLSGWRLVVARSGTRARVVLKPDATAGLPVELEGTVAGEAGRCRIDARTRTSQGTLRLSAVVDSAGKLAVTLRTPTHHESIELVPRASPNDSEETWKDRFGATLGGAHRVRLDWEQSGSRAKATLSRLDGAPSTFEGTLVRESGHFELSQPSDGKSRLRGILMGGRGGPTGMGEWLHDGAVEPFSLDRFYPTYPSTTVLPSGGRVVPVERFHHGPSDCPSSDDVFPRFEGVSAERTLNQRVETMVAPLVECHGASDFSLLGSLWSGSKYSVTASRARWVGIKFEWNSYLAGARGNFGEGCAVADTQNGELVHLNEELGPTSFAQLSPLVRRAILQAAPGKSLQDLGFYEDDPHLDAQREMCVVEDHSALFLEVVYQNDLDDAGLFQFEDVRPRLAAAVVRPFFPVGSVGAMVFR
jgi:hypothetical protein